MVLGTHSNASETANSQPVFPPPHTQQLLSSSEDLQHSTPQTCDLQAWKADTLCLPQHLCTCYNHHHCLALWTAETSWLHTAPACYSQEENCQHPKNLLNVCKGCRRRGDWVAARAENKLLYMTVHFWLAEEINAFTCCSCITVPSHTEMKCCHVQQPALHCSSRESSRSDCSPEPQTMAENV